MVARAGKYYGAAFTSAWGVMQGYPLSPTIFNILVGAVVRQWVSMVVEGAEEQVRRGQEGRHQNAFLYADNVMVAFSDP